MNKTRHFSPLALPSALAGIILITVVSAFAIVWLQQQISRTAQSTKRVELELSETMRKVAHLDALIATRHQPAFLQGQVLGKLRPSRDEQVVWVSAQPQGDGLAYTEYKPYRASVDLAQALPRRLR